MYCFNEYYEEHYIIIYCLWAIFHFTGELHIEQKGFA